MISLSISEVKPFMAKLLTHNIFDNFIVKELEIQTFTTFHVNGKLNEEFFSKEEMEERDQDGKHVILWQELRGIAFSIIKGNKTPLSLKIVFQLPDTASEELIQRLPGRLRWEDIGGLYLNIRYEKGKLSIVTGTAIRTFTLDKTLEQEWDQEVRNRLRLQGIAFEE